MSVAGRRWLILGLSVVTLVLVAAAALQPDKQTHSYDPDTAHRYSQSIALSGTGGVVLDAGFFSEGSRVGRVVTVPAVEIMDLTTGERERRPLWPNAHEHAFLGEVVAAQISPDGTKVVTGSRDGMVRIWRTDTGELLTEYHSTDIVAIAFSPDGRLVSTGHSDGDVWVSLEGANFRQLLGLEERITSLTFSPDGRRVLAGSQNGAARVWNWADETPVARLDAHLRPESAGRGDRSVSALAFSPDGLKILTGSGDGVARLWHTETGALIAERTIDANTRLSSVAFHGGGTIGFAGSDDGNAKTWRTDTGRAADSLSGWEFSPRSQWFGSSVHRQLLVAHARGYISVFHSSRPALLSIEPSTTGPFLDARFLGQSLRAAWVSFVPAIEFADIATGQRGHVLLWKSEPGEIEYLEGVKIARISPDGGLVATGAENGAVRLWNAQTGEEVSLFHQGLNAGLTSLAFSPDGTLVAAGFRDNTVRIGLTDSFGAVIELTGHVGGVNTVAFSPRGILVATGSNDSTVRLWSAASGAPVAVLGPPAESQHGAVETVLFSPNGETVAAIFTDGSVQLWNVGTHAPIALLEADRSRGPTLVVGSQGRYIKVPQSDGTARIWDLDRCSDSRCRPTITVNLSESRRPEHTTVSSDGQRIASGRDRGQIRLWALDNSEVLGVIVRPRNAIRSILFDPWGNQVLITASDSTVRVWDVAETVGY